MKLKRFGVSLEDDILKELDAYVKKNNFPNRSQALRKLIKDYLVEEKVNENKTVAGAMVIVYDHHKRLLVNKLLNIQHDYNKIILATQHIHISHNLCLEIIALKGKAIDLINLSKNILNIKGILHGKLVFTDIS
ncbi:MAG: nickel-responsive transcriptional regulator NikR [Bacteroidales bacterium]|nr:nickel-responsive transcriptional regulator NikR [Bacteroidales bacterium]